MTIFTVKIKGIETQFESDLTNNQAIGKLKKIVEAQGLSESQTKFAKALLAAKEPSENQIAWIHKIVLDAKKSTKKSPPGKQKEGKENDKEKERGHKNPLGASGYEKLKDVIGTRKLSAKTEEFAIDLLCKSRTGKLSEKQLEWARHIAGITSKPTSPTSSKSSPSGNRIPATLKNPITNRTVQVTLSRTMLIAREYKRSDLPKEWQSVVQIFESRGEKFIFK